LDGSLPGDYGFDPLSLGVEPYKLKWYVQAELQNARWAMLAVAGILVPEVLKSIGAGGPAADVAWFNVADFQFYAPVPALIAVANILFAWAEGNRCVGKGSHLPGNTQFCNMWAASTYWRV
jgi:hypothetical protein